MSESKKSLEEKSLKTTCNDNEISSEDIDSDFQEKDKNLKISLYRFFGLLIIILSLVIVPLIIVSYFYHPGQSDTTALLIEQIFGYVLASIGLIIGSIMFFHSQKLRKEKILLEPLVLNEKEEIDEIMDS